MSFNEFLIFTGYTLCFGTDLSISMSHSVGEEWSVSVKPGDGTGEEALDTWIIRRDCNVNEEASEEDTESSEITEEEENYQYRGQQIHLFLWIPINGYSGCVQTY